MQRQSVRGSPGSEGETLIEAFKAAENVQCHRGEPDLARLPKGFEADGERAVLLRHKAIVARTNDHMDPPGAIIGAKGKGWLLEKAEALMPLIRWLVDMIAPRFARRDQGGFTSSWPRGQFTSKVFAALCIKRTNRGDHP